MLPLKVCRLRARCGRRALMLPVYLLAPLAFGRLQSILRASIQQENGLQQIATFACRRESSTSSLTSSRPATIEYFHEVHLLPLAASSRAFIATERRLHHEHRRRPRRRAGAQVGQGALVVGGGEWRGSEHGVDPPRWASRSSVQETCIPSRGERELDLIFPLLPAIRLPHAAQNGESARRACSNSPP